MEDIQLAICKSLLNYEKASALELMRSNAEFLDLPGYKFSEIINKSISEGYINRIEDVNKSYYSATEKCRNLFK